MTGPFGAGLVLWGKVNVPIARRCARSLGSESMPRDFLYMRPSVCGVVDACHFIKLKDNSKKDNLKNILVCSKDNLWHGPASSRISNGVIRCSGSRFSSLE